MSQQSFRLARMQGVALRGFVAAILLLLPLPLVAETQTIQDAPLEISGLVIDKTRSKFGRDFARLFQSYWGRVELGPIAYSIVLLEKNIVFRGGTVEIHLDGRIIARVKLTPKYDDLDQLAQKSVKQVLQLLLQQQRNLQQLDYY